MPLASKGPAEFGVSPTTGFLPEVDPLDHLPTAFDAWEQVAQSLPKYLMSDRLRPMIDAKPSNGLRLRSQIMTDKMISLRYDRIRRVIGHIDRETSEQLDRALLVVLGLTR